MEGPLRVIGPEDLEIGELLGSGSQGSVFRATWLSCKLAVAVKRFDDDSGLDGLLGTGREEVDKMRRVAQDSALVVRVYGVARVDGRLHIVMQLCEGSMAQRLADLGQGLPKEEFVDVAMRVVEGLRDLHRCDILHCDLKPENILLDRDGQALLADFGLAKIMGQRGAEGGAVRRYFQAHPNYAAPEMWDGLGRISRATDVYCAAATLCHIASGRMPYEGLNVQQIQQHQRLGRSPPVPNCVPEPLRGKLAQALRCSQEDRVSLDDLVGAAKEAKDIVRGLKLVDCLVCQSSVQEATTAICSAGRHRLCGACLGRAIEQADAKLDESGRVVCAMGCAPDESVFRREDVMTKAPVEARVTYLDKAGREHGRRAMAQQEAELRRLQDDLDRLVMDGQGGGAQAVATHTRLIEDLLCAFRCPGCRIVSQVEDFTECLAVSCGSCRAHYCAWCLEDCQSWEGAHMHVPRCPKNPRPGRVFGEKEEFDGYWRAIKRERVVQHLMEIRPDLRERVWRGVLPTIADLGIQWQDVAPPARDPEPPAAPIADDDGPPDAVPPAAPAAPAAPPAVPGWEAVVARAAARGGEVDLQGATVTLRAALSVKGVRLVVRNGQIKAEGAAVGGVYVVQALAGGVVELRDLRLRGGVLCAEGGRVAIAACMVEDSPRCGVRVTGRGSEATVDAGVVTGAAADGVEVSHGAHVQLNGTQVVEARRCGVLCVGEGSKAVLENCRVELAMKGDGVACSLGGCAELRDTHVDKCMGCGVHVAGPGSRVTMERGSVAGSKDWHGVCCELAGSAQLTDVAVTGCRGAGVAIVGPSGALPQGRAVAPTLSGPRRFLTEDSAAEPTAQAYQQLRDQLRASEVPLVTVQGGAIEGHAGSGVRVEMSGRAKVEALEIRGCAEAGATCTSGGVLEMTGVQVHGVLPPEGGEGQGDGLVCDGGVVRFRGVPEQRSLVAGVQRGVLCQRGGRVKLAHFRIDQCASHGVQCQGSQSAVKAEDGAVQHIGGHEGTGISAEGGGQVHAVRVEISSIAAHGARCSAKGVLTLEDVMVQDVLGGTGVQCDRQGKATLRRCTVRGCDQFGVLCVGKSSKAVVHSGSIGDVQTGVGCQEGGCAEMHVPAIEGCREQGLRCHGPGSAVAVKGGSVRDTGGGVMAGAGVDGGCGVRCEAGGEAKLERMTVERSRGPGVASTGRGSRVTLSGAQVQGSGQCGLLCADGAVIAAAGTAISQSARCGVSCGGEGSAVELQSGCLVKASGWHGVECVGGARLEVAATQIEGAQQCGVFCQGAGSRFKMEGGAITGVAELHAVWVQGGGMVRIKEVTVSRFAHQGVACSGAKSEAYVVGGSIDGSERGQYGVVGTGGGLVVVKRTRVVGCAEGGILCERAGTRGRVREVVVSGTQKLYGVCCQEVAEMEVDKTEVRGCVEGSGLACFTGATLVVHRSNVADCRAGNGLCCTTGASATLTECRIWRCGQSGVVCCGEGSRVAVCSGVVEECGQHGLACSEAGAIEALGTQVKGCGGRGLSTDTPKSLRHKGVCVTSCSGQEDMGQPLSPAAALLVALVALAVRLACGAARVTAVADAEGSGWTWLPPNA